MIRKNEDIRTLVRKMNVHLWEVAYRYGCNDGNFSRKLRKELTEAEKERIKQIVEEIIEERMIKNDYSKIKNDS